MPLLRWALIWVTQRNRQTGVVAPEPISASQLDQCIVLYHSKPMGPDQPDYVNAVCQVECHDLTAEQLLALLHHVEDEFGQQRFRHWGERTLDLDLLLFDDVRSDTEVLKLRIQVFMSAASYYSR